MDGGILVVARIGLMVDLALLMGLPLFALAMGGRVRRGVLTALALGGLALSALWLLASAAGMSGTAIFPPDQATVRHFADDDADRPDAGGAGGNVVAGAGAGGDGA